jgi:hypothetical protein
MCEEWLVLRSLQLLEYFFMVANFKCDVEEAMKVVPAQTSGTEV